MTSAAIVLWILVGVWALTSISHIVATRYWSPTGKALWTVVNILTFTLAYPVFLMLTEGRAVLARAPTPSSTRAKIGRKILIVGRAIMAGYMMLVLLLTLAGGGIALPILLILGLLIWLLFELTGRGLMRGG